VAAIAVAGVTGYRFVARGKTSASPPVIVKAQGQAAPSPLLGKLRSRMDQTPRSLQVRDPPAAETSKFGDCCREQENQLTSAAPTPSKPTGTAAATPSPEPPVAVFRGVKAGNGFATDCTIPIIQGTPQPATATIPLPHIAPRIVTACKIRNPKFGQPVQGGGANSASTPAN
jgi:hypothetical protein